MELQELSTLAESADHYSRKYLCEEKTLFLQHRDCENEEVTKRLAGVKETDYTRLPERIERQKLQKTVLGLPEFPTTTIGSFPQTKDVKANRSAFRKGEISEEQYVEFNKKKIEECVRWQERDRTWMYSCMANTKEMTWLNILVKRWEVFCSQRKHGFSHMEQDVLNHLLYGEMYTARNPITVEWSVYAQSLTNKIMKGMLTGPVTILNWSFPREDITIKESISQIALAIRDEVLDLEANGIKIIQIDEAALREKLPLRKSDWNTEYLEFAIPAFRLTASGVKPETQIHTHMCYSEFTDIISAIDDMDADVITFEASRSDLQIFAIN